MVRKLTIESNKEKLCKCKFHRLGFHTCDGINIKYYHQDNFCKVYKNHAELLLCLARCPPAYFPVCEEHLDKKDEVINNNICLFIDNQHRLAKIYHYEPMIDSRSNIEEYATLSRPKSLFERLCL